MRNIVADMNTVSTSLKSIMRRMEPGQEIKVSITRQSEQDEWFVKVSYPDEDAEEE